MPTYKVKDTVSGKTVSLTGDSPPTEQELENIFSQVAQPQEPQKTSVLSTLGRDIPLVGKAVGALRETIPSKVAETSGKLGFPKTGVAVGGTVGTIGELLPKTIGEAGLTLAAGPIGRGVGKAIKATYPLRKELIKRTSGVIGGTAGEAFERLVQKPKEILAEIPKVADDAGRLKEFGQKFIQSIHNNFAQAQNAYDDLIRINLLENPKYSKMRFDLAGSVGDEMAQIQRKYGFGLPGRLGESGREADIFNKINSLIQSKKAITKTRLPKGLGPDVPVMTTKYGPTADEIYYLQRDINGILKTPSLEGTPLQAALVEVDQSLQRYLKKRIPEIAKANDIYSKAAKLRQFATGTLERIEDFPTKVASAFRRNTAFKDKLEEVAKELPEARRSLEALRDSQAALSFAPKIAPMARTGLTAGLGALGLGAAGLNPLAMAGSAAIAPFASPRLTANIVGRYPAAVQAVKTAIPSYVTPGKAALAALALSRKRKEQGR